VKRKESFHEEEINNKHIMNKISAHHFQGLHALFVTIFSPFFFLPLSLSLSPTMSHVLTQYARHVFFFFDWAA
jgi:hypothetical protein